MSKNKEYNRRRHDFLLTFFEKPDVYESKEVNGWTLVRQFNANNSKWEVAIWLPGSFSLSLFASPKLETDLTKEKA